MIFEIEEYEILDSTSSFAKRFIKNSTAWDRSGKCKVIVSKKQTKGYGTQNRTWISEIGNIFLSAIVPLSFFPAINLSNCGIIAIASGVGVSKAIGPFCGDNKVQLKWPNDVLVNEKKIAGILVELEEDTAIVGIGVNISSSPRTIEKTTSIFEVNQSNIPFEFYDEAFYSAFLKNLVTELFEAFEKLKYIGFNYIKKEWETLCNCNESLSKLKSSYQLVGLGERGEMLIRKTDSPEKITSIEHSNFEFK